jgi:N-acetylglutamate synthase-like GNAT family acetyltransferase
MLTVVWIIRQEQQQQCARYWVMEYDGQIIGCGRVDVHRQHSEIYDLFVLAEWRSCGIGQAIMQQLMAQATRPIYLASLPKAVAFYQRLGFKPIASQDLPWPLMHRLSLSNQCYRRARLQAMILQ